MNNSKFKICLKKGHVYVRKIKLTKIISQQIEFLKCKRCGNIDYSSNLKFTSRSMWKVINRIENLENKVNLLNKRLKA